MQSIPVNQSNNTVVTQFLRAPSNKQVIHPYLQKMFPNSPQFRYVGGGSFGTAYMFEATPGSLKDLQTLEPLLTNSIRGKGLSSIRPGQQMVIKIASPRTNKNKSWAEFIKECKHESAAQRTLRKRTTKTTCGKTIEIVGKTFVPTLFMAGSDTSNGVYVFVMEVASGRPLESFNGPVAPAMPAKLYVQIEAAVMSMWALGYAHGDLHFGNLLYNDVTNKVTIIDFGMAVALNRSIRERIRCRIDDVIHNITPSTTLWTATGARAFVHTIFAQRGRKWLNDDGKTLQVAYHLVPKNERVKIPALRAALWTQSRTANNPNPKKIKR